MLLVLCDRVHRHGTLPLQGLLQLGGPDTATTVDILSGLPPVAAEPAQGAAGDKPGNRAGLL